MRYFLLEAYPSGALVQRLPAARSDRLFDVVIRAGLPMRTRCQGSSLCGQCWVRVAAGQALPPALPDEQALLDRHAPGVAEARLACRLRIPPGQDQLRVATDYWGASTESRTGGV